MITAIITPTKRYGGLGEQHYWLTKQNYTDFTWFIADDLYDERADVVAELTVDSPFEVVHFKPQPKPEGYWSNLAGIYNELLDRCHDLCADAIISLQDYILVPVDGVARMLIALQRTESTVTGLTSYSDVPPPEDVYDYEGGWTIFRSVYKEWPETLYWKDVREPAYAPESISNTNCIEWELNWAGIPGDIVRAGLRFDPDYGKYIAYENQDFAWRAFLEYDKQPYVDTGNHAISLPHQLYWPDERAVMMDYSKRNGEMHEKKYEPVLRVMMRGKL